MREHYQGYRPYKGPNSKQIKNKCTLRKPPDEGPSKIVNDVEQQ